MISLQYLSYLALGRCKQYRGRPLSGDQQRTSSCQIGDHVWTLGMRPAVSINSARLWLHPFASSAAAAIAAFQGARECWPRPGKPGRTMETTGCPRLQFHFGGQECVSTSLISSNFDCAKLSQKSSWTLKGALILSMAE